MTVQELTKLLSFFDPDLPVRVSSDAPPTFAEISDISEVRSLSSYNLMAIRMKGSHVNWVYAGDNKTAAVLLIEGVIEDESEDDELSPDESSPAT
jgi:hypothetical protein